MCNRHVVHMIADYEAAKLDEDEEGTDRAESHDAEQTTRNQSGLLATLRSRLARDSPAKSISLLSRRLG